MGDATVKPSAGDDLVLSNDDGSAKIEVNEGAEINVTIGSASGDDLNVGSGKLVVEGDTGKVVIGSDTPDTHSAKLEVQDGTSAVVKDLISLKGYRYSPWQIRVDDTESSVSKYQVGFASNTEAMTIRDNGNFDIGGASHSARRFSVKSSATDDSVNAVEIFDSSDATLFKMLSNGIITAPKQPAFLCVPSSQQANPGNNDTVVWGTEVIDKGSNFASNTFTAPVTGMYQLSVSLRMSGGVDFSNTVYIGLTLITSNNTFQWIFDPRVYDASGTYFMMSQTTTCDMDASDTAHVIFFINSSTSTQSDIDTSSHFSGFLVS